MSPLFIGLLGVIALLVMVALRAPLGLGLLLAGFAGLWSLHGLDTAIYVASTAPVTALSSYTLSVLPLFILMGALSVRAGLAEALYKSAFGFVGHRRGGLAMASIAACGGFGAICGSSLATVTTMGRVAVPEMLRYGYDQAPGHRRGRRGRNARHPDPAFPADDHLCDRYRDFCRQAVCRRHDSRRHRCAVLHRGDRDLGANGARHRPGGKRVGWRERVHCCAVYGASSRFSRGHGRHPRWALFAY
jgi:hypothetical protein